MIRRRPTRWAAGAALLTVGVWTLRHYGQWRQFFPPCPTYYFFHLYCPGCGTTRALACLARGDLPGVFRHNLMLLPALTAAALLLWRPALLRHYKAVNCLVAALLLFGVLRNLPWHPFTLLAP